MRKDELESDSITVSHLSHEKEAGARPPGGWSCVDIGLPVSGGMGGGSFCEISQGRKHHKHISD